LVFHNDGKIKKKRLIISFFKEYYLPLHDKRIARWLKALCVAMVGRMVQHSSWVDEWLWAVFMPSAARNAS
jgi:hypothetical protein